MLRNFICILILVAFFSCKESTQQVASPPTGQQPSLAVEEDAFFFPISDYMMGQIKMMKEGQENPILHTFIENQHDSTWIQLESIDSILKDFTQPYIDSVRLAPYFKETKFEDATLNMVTLSYDAVDNIPNDIPWYHWDIYIDPESGEVKRIYLVKYLSKNMMQQLHFKSGDSWKVTTLSTGKDAHVISEKILMLK